MSATSRRASHPLQPMLVCLLWLLGAGCQPTTAALTPTPFPPTATVVPPQPLATLAPPVAATALTAVPPSPLPPPTAQGQSTHGNLFVYTALNGDLMIQDVTSHHTTVLLPASSKDFYDGPSFAPDGSRIIFVYSSFDAANNPIDEVRTIGVDGSNLQTLFRSSGAGGHVFLSDPTLTADGRTVYFSTLDPSAKAAENKFHVVRGSAAGGEWTPVLANAFLPSASPDGQWLAFLRPNPQTFVSSLWVAMPDGTNARQLLADNVFLDLSGVRFAPDSQWIAFAESGPASKKLPTSQAPTLPQLAVDACAVRVLFVCLATRADANGLPWELWLVSVDGKSFRQLTRLQLDSPWPAFSRDGRYVGFMTFNGTFEVDRQSNRVSKLSDVGGHGTIDWYQH